MKPDWLIQTNMEGVYTGTMIAEVLAQGMQVRRIKHQLGVNIDFSGYNPHDCIVCYGDIDFVRQVYSQAPFVPGAWCNFDHMKCSTYYAYFGEHLLNKQYIMMPISDLLRRWDDLVTIVPIFTTDELLFMMPTFTAEPCKSLFIRPNSGAKPFTGYVVASDEKHKIQTLVQAVGPETLIIVASEKSITAEWRFVICDKEVVTGCQYLPNESKWFAPESFRLAYKIAKHKWQPDICYTVDIAESGGKMHLLEINSFSCAAFYSCDIKSIVYNASDIAIKEWKSYR